MALCLGWPGSLFCGCQPGADVHWSGLGAGVCGKVGCLLHSFQPVKRVSISLLTVLPSLGGGVIEVM